MVFYFLCPCMKLNRLRHSCIKTPEDSATETSIVWEPSKGLKHLNLKVLVMTGFEEEDKVTNYIRLIMELAVGLIKIKLKGHPCEWCSAVDHESLERFQADEASRRRVREYLRNGSSSSVEIIVC